MRWKIGRSDGDHVLGQLNRSWKAIIYEFNPAYVQVMVVICNSDDEAITYRSRHGGIHYSFLFLAISVNYYVFKKNPNEWRQFQSNQKRLVCLSEKAPRSDMICVILLFALQTA